MTTSSPFGNLSTNLVTVRDWPGWFMEFRRLAMGKGVWDVLNPDGPDSPHLLSLEPPLVSFEEATEFAEARAKEFSKKILIAWEDLLPPSSPEARDDRPPKPELIPPPTWQDAMLAWDILSHRRQEERNMWERKLNAYLHIGDWLMVTVDPAIMALIYAVEGNEMIPLQRVVREIRQKVARTPALIEYHTQIFQRAMRQRMEKRLKHKALPHA